MKREDDSLFDTLRYLTSFCKPRATSIALCDIDIYDTLSFLAANNVQRMADVLLDQQVTSPFPRGMRMVLCVGNIYFRYLFRKIFV